MFKNHFAQERKSPMPNKEKSTIDVVKIVGIITGGIVTIGFLAFYSFIEYLGRTTETDGAYSSPIAPLIVPMGAILVAVIGAFVGTSAITNNLGKKVDNTTEKIDKIEKQTNGRTHIKDEQLSLQAKALNVLMEKLGEKAEDVANLAFTNQHNSANPPEDDYCEEELELQKKMLQDSIRMAELRKQRKEQTSN